MPRDNRTTDRVGDGSRQRRSICAQADIDTNCQVVAAVPAASSLVIKGLNPIGSQVIRSRDECTVIARLNVRGGTATIGVLFRSKIWKLASSAANSLSRLQSGTERRRRVVLG